MRIGIDIRALMEGKITGVQIYVINLLNALFAIDRVNQYVLFANSFSRIEPRVKVFPAPNIEYKIFHYPNKIFNPAQKFLRIPDTTALLGGVDLLFSPHFRSVVLPKCVPLVITFHDLAYEVMPQFFTFRQRLWHKFMNYRGAAERANKIVAVSESTKWDLVKLYRVPAEKIRVIYPGVKLADHGEALSGLPKKYFLSLGTFEPRKNLSSVLAAYARYHEQSSVKLPLVLAGSSGWKTHLTIPEEMANSIFVYENITEAQKRFLYEHAFALLFLSYYEGFGFPVLEASSSGVPVIASANTSLLEIGANFVLFVNSFRPTQVAQAMLGLESDPAYYSSCRANGLREAAKFTWDNTAKKMLELFQEYK